MTVSEMIEKYRIYLHSETQLGVKGSPSKADLEEIKAHKPEIIAELVRREADKKAAFEERERKIHAIPGLDEIKAAMRDVAAWDREYDRRFDEYDVGSADMRPRPEYDIDAMLEQHPAAAAYIKADKAASSANYEIASIGQRALDAIIDDPDDYASAIDKMDAETKAFAERHMWD